MDGKSYTRNGKIEIKYMTYNNDRQFSDKEFDEYFEEVYAHENNPESREVIEFFSEIDTLDEESDEEETEE